MTDLNLNNWIAKERNPKPTPERTFIKMTDWERIKQQKLQRTQTDLAIAEANTATAVANLAKNFKTQRDRLKNNIAKYK